MQNQSDNLKEDIVALEQIKKSDWKKFQEKIGEWQELYMDKLLKEYITFLQEEDKNPSERFWRLEERIKKDKKRPGVRIRLEKKEAIFDAVRLIKLGVIDFDNIKDFSEEFQKEVKSLMGRMANW
ncbi:MAG: hypothetical protein Q4E53_13600 [Eubacteriales bacterium]|nr:hypothetical protein [Eubacteriales bacterium]